MLVWLIALISIASSASASGDEAFRFHLSFEPHTLDPQTPVSSSGNYVVHNIYRGLMKYDRDKGLLPEGAVACKSGRLKLECPIAPKHLWSDGKPVVAADYVRSLRRLINPDNKFPQAEYLLSLKNAREIWAGKLPPEKLGVVARKPNTLRFEFASPDEDFVYKLTHPALSPLREEGIVDLASANQQLVTGPYKIREWLKGNRVILEPNLFYQGNPKRPMVEAFFLADDNTALQMYELGKMALLRRLPTAQVKYRSHPDFIEVPIGRFDYLGFSRDLKNYPKLRRALSLSLDFVGLQKIFGSPGTPGCPALPERMYDGPLCIKQNNAAAKALYAEQAWPKDVPKVFGFSNLGGDDMIRAAEWFQGQWKKQLGLLLELEPKENGLFLAQMKTKPPPVFRKGVGLDRPSCLAGLEIFLKDHPENFIGLDSPAYEKIVTKLRSEPSAIKQRKLCTKAIRLLIDENWIIPLGEFRFFMLASPRFKGWKINFLNQLDLSHLKR